MKRRDAVSLAAFFALVLAGSAWSESRPVEAPPEKDIVETAVDAGSFETLVAALKAAGLVETLKGKGPFTVFAPTDAAFEKLPEGTLESLLEPENREQLRSILTYHVVAGTFKASDVTRLESAKTVNGQSISFRVKDGRAYANEAKIVRTDIVCTNGVIHVIDSVLLPKAKAMP